MNEFNNIINNYVSQVRKYFIASNMISQEPDTAAGSDFGNPGYRGQLSLYKGIEIVHVGPDFGNPGYNCPVDKK